ncbi:MAG: hypothetical protein RR873_05610, partial [Christensenella sp.]
AVGIIDAAMTDDGLYGQIKDAIREGNVAGDFSNVQIKEYDEYDLNDEQAYDVQRQDEREKSVVNAVVGSVGGGLGGLVNVPKAVQGVIGGLGAIGNIVNIVQQPKHPKAGKYISAKIVVLGTTDSAGNIVNPTRELNIRLCEDDFENTTLNRILIRNYD